MAGPSKCTICTSTKLAQVDEALVAGESVRSIGRRLSVGWASVHRHSLNHLPPGLLVPSAPVLDPTAGPQVLERLMGLVERVTTILDRAERKGSLQVAVSAIREHRNTLELIAKIVGELNERPQINVLVQPQWLDLRQVIQQALAPYPEAQRALVAALEQQSEVPALVEVSR